MRSSVGQRKIEARRALDEQALDVRKRDITATVAAALVAEQFPQWGHLPVTAVALDGWDNTTYRLGDDLLIRLPSADIYVAQIEKEHRWLPVLARELPLPIPEPVVQGEPSDTFPRPWSIYRWIDGVHATVDRIDDATAFASDVAGFLEALYAIDACDGPLAGAHSHSRGAHVEVWDDQTRASIEILGDDIDAEAATAVWDAALASHWAREPVWVHGDVAPANLLVADGRLGAVIDFGCSAVGDPACDLVLAWTFLSDDAAATFRRELALDDDTWARGRGWALWKALIMLANEKRGGPNADAGARRAGWWRTTRGVIDTVIADA